MKHRCFWCTEQAEVILLWQDGYRESTLIYYFCKECVITHKFIENPDIKVLTLKKEIA